jgi:2-hydroxycyclohexanecarboxyl-CoA dehydrogenase
MDLGLRDAAVVVTGGGSNIGRAIVHAFAAEGARLLIADRDDEQAAIVVTEALERGAGAADRLAVDVTAAGAGETIADAALERFGSLDVLVNNVGWSEPDFFQHTDADEWQKTFDLNLLSALACTRAAIAPMAAAGRGAIVFISSDAAFGEPRTAVYGAMKAGLIAFARSIAREHGRDGIRTNVVCPGVVVPDEGAIGAGSLWSVGREAIFDDDQLASIERAVPLRRRTEAADVANAVVFFASERASRQLTGQVVSVSGGFAMP